MFSLPVPVAAADEEPADDEPEVEMETETAAAGHSSLATILNEGEDDYFGYEEDY